MPRKRKSKIMVGDFETTVYKGQTETEVWASALVELGSEDVKIFHSIQQTFKYLTGLSQNVIVYYHNLKFDGNFWLYYLMNELEFEQASTVIDEQGNIEWCKDKDMPNNSFRYVISNMGQWYTVIIKVNGYIIELRDSLKLLPFSVREIGKGFKTKHQKLDMEYEGYRYAGCAITDEEKKYIANDVLVVKEALEVLAAEGHDGLTIGACCLAEFRKGYSDLKYRDMFPDLTKVEIDASIYGSDNADDYIRRSYKGGWCYVVKGKESRRFYSGTTADVNSLYPSMMSSKSGNRYPVGMPNFWSGNYIPILANNSQAYFFIRIECRFKIKENKLPFIQIKRNCLYKSTEALETSDIWDKKNKVYSRYYVDNDGTIKDSRVILTLTKTDWILFNEHYDVFDLKILDGCWFHTKLGIFDEYIDKYKKIKMESTGARRTLAKLFLNNLYGKMASSTHSDFKIAYADGDGVIHFTEQPENKKKVGYIPVGSAITSYARNFTIRAAQANYHGLGKRGFIYADTDSIHCDLLPHELKGITVDDKEFCCWKLESCWDTGWFVRQKTYMEHVVQEDCKDVKPYWNVKCAGMPAVCKDKFVALMNNREADVEDFSVGLCIGGKLVPKRIKGGVILAETTFEMR